VNKIIGGVKMETIRQYVENLFSEVYETPETQVIKEEMISDMEDRYEFLISKGMRDNEALGQVITEFGNIDEIIKEFRTSQNEADRFPDIHVTSAEEIFEFINVRRRAGSGTGIGVGIILLGTAVYMAMLGIMGDTGLANALGIVCILLSVVIAIGCFIFSHSRLSDFNHLEKTFAIDIKLRNEIKDMKNEYKRSYNLGITMGVALIIFSVIPVIITSLLNFSETAVLIAISMLLLVVGIACYIFIYSNYIWGAFDIILKQGMSYSELKDVDNKTLKRNRRIVKLLDDFYWPFVVIIYLIISFTLSSWAFSWIIFLVAGLLEDVILGIFDINEGS